MSALAAVAPRLRCPVCHAPLRVERRVLGCTAGHRFDVARQGHVALLPPRGRAAAGDGAAMVQARAAFLAAGHFAPLTAALADAARAALPEVPTAGAPTAVPAAGALPEVPAGGALPDAAPADDPTALVVDAGAGTGHHLAGVLDALPGALGLALDASGAAARRAARAHPRVAAVVCDLWRELPVADGAAAVVLDVFAPRNGAEFARVLAPGGALVVATPTPRHLAELAAPLGLLAVDPRKPERLRAALPAELAPEARQEVAFDLALDAAGLRALVAMGPSAHHVAPADLAARIAALPEGLRVRASVVVETFRRVA